MLCRDLFPDWFRNWLDSIVYSELVDLYVDFDVLEQIRNLEPVDWNSLAKTMCQCSGLYLQSIGGFGKLLPASESTCSWQTSTWVTANKWQQRLLESVTVSGLGLISELRTINLVLILNTLSLNKVHTTHHWHLFNKGIITTLFEHIRSWFYCYLLLKLIKGLRLTHYEKQCTTCLVGFKTIYRDSKQPPQPYNCFPSYYVKYPFISFINL